MLVRVRGGAAIGANERGWCLARVSARAGVRPSTFCSWPHGRDGDERLRLKMASCWAYFVGGRGLRLLGCVVWVTVQLAATCLVMRRLVRRENASRDLDLSAACTACDGRGRSLRRSRAPRARRGRLQRACDGCGMYCGRSGGGRVLVGAIYSDFKVAQGSFAF